jgi:putative two-component system response regulator
MANEPAKPIILVVDDTEDIRDLIMSVLQDTYTLRPAFDGRSALKRALEKPAPDLILLDVDMPGSSGHDVCRALKVTAATAEIPVIFLTGRDEPADVVKGFQIGAADYIIKPLNAEVLRARVRNHLELSYRRRQQEALVRERTEELETARVQLVRRLARTMEYHESTAVGNRVVRLGHYARLIAEAAGAKPDLADLMMKAAPLHDIGKLGVPAQVLHKSSGLSAPEWEQMKKHAEIGAEIIGVHDDPLLSLARTLALTHHERWDGNGYPKGLKGEDIPWPGRVMAAVDTFEALTVTRFHQEPLPIDGAMSLIERASGTQFDPAIVAALKQVLPDMRAIRDTYADQLGDLVDLDFASPTAPDKRSLVPPNPAAKRDPEGVARLQKATADEERALRLARQRNQAELEAIR